MMHRTACLLVTVILPVALAAQTRTTLDIYLVDVEGGNATLFVAPSGESLLIDTGNGGQAAARDADRIMAAVTDAGLQRIDHLITTHYHGDHFGAMSELASRIPIGNFIDHGANVQPNPATDAFLTDVYPALHARSKHTVVKPGDRVAMQGVDIRIVASAGQLIRDALPGAGQSNRAVRGASAEGCGPERERTVGRKPLHVRPVPRVASRRPHVEQRIRARLPEQLAGIRGPVHRDAPRSAGVECARARSCASRRAWRS